jgi:hypothetical protein
MADLSRLIFTSPLEFIHLAPLTFVQLDHQLHIENSELMHDVLVHIPEDDLNKVSPLRSHSNCGYVDAQMKSLTCSA